MSVDWTRENTESPLPSSLRKRVEKQMDLVTVENQGKYNVTHYNHHLWPGAHPLPVTSPSLCHAPSLSGLPRGKIISDSQVISLSLLPPKAQSEEWTEYDSASSLHLRSLPGAKRWFWLTVKSTLSLRPGLVIQK